MSREHKFSTNNLKKMFIKEKFKNLTALNAFLDGKGAEVGTSFQDYIKKSRGGYRCLISVKIITDILEELNIDTELFYETASWRTIYD